MLNQRSSKNFVVPWLLAGLLVILTLPAGASHDGPRHSILERRASWGEFVALWKGRYKNYSLVDVEVVEDGGKTWYYGIWHLVDNGRALYAYDSWKAFTDKWSELSENGKRLVDLDVRRAGGRNHYVGTFENGNYGYYLYSFSSWKDFVDKWKELNGKGYRLVDTEVNVHLDYLHSGRQRLLKETRGYYGVWRSGTGGYALYSQGWGPFNAKRSELKKKGLKLIDVAMSNESGKIKYTGVWRSGGGSNAFYKYSNFNDIHKKWGELDAKGYTMVDIEALRIGRTTHYAGVWR